MFIKQLGRARIIEHEVSVNKSWRLREFSLTEGSCLAHDGQLWNKTVNSVPKASSIYHNTTGSDSLQLSIFAEF